jgi:phosphopantothenoylcysteine decarboxylase/phosphopantothenate--cysteine ligase
MAHTLTGKKILLGVTGSIAAYKAAWLVRLFVKAGAEVKVILTPSAREFITPLTLSTLSRNPVLHALAEEDSWANHVALGRWADLMVMAPLSCNTLAKMASGQCDNLLMAVYLSATCPVMVAPAMDEDMWKHPSTKSNLDKLVSFGHQVIPVAHGELASGLTGEGRMAEPEGILAAVEAFLGRPGPLTGRKALVTAGPTYEPIDPVRFIGNHSSGKMGIALAQALQEKGAEVTLVLGPVSQTPPTDGIELVQVFSAKEMYEACSSRFTQMDIAVMAAAVADYTPVQVAEQKIKKEAGEWSLPLQRTTDILRSLGEQKQKGQLLVGFALETEHERDNAMKKLVSKHADLIVLNSLNDPGAGFGHDTNKVAILDPDGGVQETGTLSKQEVARIIVERIIKSLHA